MAKITTDSFLLSSNPVKKVKKIEKKYLVLFTANTNIFTLLYGQQKRDCKVSFLSFAVGVMLILSINLSINSTEREQGTPVEDHLPYKIFQPGRCVIDNNSWTRPPCMGLFNIR